MNRRHFIGSTGAVVGLLAARSAAAEAVARLARHAGQGWAGLRGSYRLDPGITYLNHASIGTIPEPLLDAHRGYLDLCESNPWLHMWGGAWEQGREDTRAAAAGLLGCEPDEIAITHNTTEGFNLLAQGLPLGPGDEVLFSSLNHAGASVAWARQAPRRGFEVRQFGFPVTRAAEMSSDDLVAQYEAAIGPRTAVLVFPHIDNIVGFRYPLGRLVQIARSRGVRYVAVDGAQSAAMVPLDLTATGIDFYSTSGHKWLQGPKGTGLLYIRRATREHLEPMWVTWGQERWQGSVRIFEDYGTRNLAAILTLGDAIGFQQQLGEQPRLEQLSRLWSHARARADASDRISWRSPRRFADGAALFAVEIEGVRSQEAARQLYDEHGIVCRPFSSQGLNTIRLSPNVFNSEAELDRFFDLGEQLRGS